MDVAMVLWSMFVSDMDRTICVLLSNAQHSLVLCYNDSSLSNMLITNQRIHADWIHCLPESDDMP